MKKILILAMISLFLASCIGEAVSKSVEDINIIVSPPTAGLKVELYSGSLLMGSAVTNSKGSVTFGKLPIGAYRAVIYDASGVKITDKYMTSVFVSGPNAFKSYVNIPKAPVASPPAPTPIVVPVPTPPLVQICTPNQLWCVGNILKSCNFDGTQVKQTVCASPTPLCDSTLTKCVQCSSSTDCTGGQICSNNACVTPAQVCIPNQITCKTANTKSVCNSAGTAVTDTVCTAPNDKCAAGVGCVECNINADCASGNCQNNVCVAPACVQCPYPRTDCNWVFKNLCTPLGEGGYPTCTAFIFYNPNAPCSWGNRLGIVPTDQRGSVNVAGRVTPVPIYPQYECCLLGGAATTPSTPSPSTTSPIATVHCPNGIVEPALGEECEPPNTLTCDANCKKISVPPIIHCPNGVVEPAFGEECEPPNTVTCDTNCKKIPAPLLPPGVYWMPYSPCAVPTVAGYSSCNLASYNCPTGVNTGPTTCTASLGTICVGPAMIDLPVIPNTRWYFLYKCSTPPTSSPLG